MEYQKINIKKYPRPIDKTSEESRYWKKFKSTAHIKEFAAVTSIDFSPVKPHDFCISSSARVQVYSTQTQTLKKTISRFQDVVTHSSFRNDGKLIVAGDASGSLQVFDMKSRAILRSIKAHSSAVRQCRFMPSNTCVASVSDDKTVKIWDITSQSIVKTFEEEHGGHTDYIRTMAVSKTSNDILITGSYDSTVKVWDLRANSCVHTFHHDGMSVEAVLTFPGDSMVAAAAGNRLFIWDILGGGSGQLAHCSSNHQKTITSLCFNKSHSRIFTGSLDHQVKIFDVSDYSVAHSIKYPSPVLSVGMSPDDHHLVTGMVSGMLSIRRKRTDKSAITESPENRSIWAMDSSNQIMNKHEKELLKARPGTQRFFLRGRHKVPSEDDHVVLNERKPRLLEFERRLRSFEHGAALDSALEHNLPPESIITLLDELKSRDQALINALSARDEISLEPVLKFILRHIKNNRYADILYHVLNVILDLYSSVIHESPLIEDIVNQIQVQTLEEVRFQKELFGMVGVMDMLMGFSECIRQ